MLRWGVLSTANINNRFIPQLLKSPRSQVTAIASRSIEKAESAAKMWNIPKVYGSYDDLLTDSEINAVYIPLPNSLHAEWAVRAAEQGKHCIVEKPITTKISDVDKLQKVAKEHNVLIVEGFVHIHHPQFKAIKEKITSGCIGALQYMTGSFCFKVDQEDNIMYSREHDGGSLWNLGCYPISLMIALLGESPQTVTAMKCETKSGVDGTCHCILQFSNSRHGCISASCIASSGTNFEIIGSKGKISLNKIRAFHPDCGDNANYFDVSVSGEPEERVTVPNVDAFLSEITAFEASVLDGISPVVSLELSKLIVTTIIALHKSACQGGMPVSL
ncbi:putative oxidoreductase ORF334 [Saccoglossus kowalevskii]|uniref:Trans-1,2-dihydrobenzene-1,2-diol dehydrogenase n=1 Tax=Saccoglossus kowalevskii TaxID=10224 RepID=A0A1L7H7F3_SACKO|nr:PREDICTED: trans-1,2-dihydrobenzene-1,2-diol dehydrogenase-like [Saccoglossus kowalevskii]APU50769.1 diol dehydrogenase-like protein 102 [Saccoglossus kowalevskii]